MFRIKSLSLISMLIAALVMSACTPAANSIPSIPPTQVPQNSSNANPHLTLDQLKNSTYPSSFTASGRIQLTNGQATQDIAAGSASKLTVQLADQYAFGDLNGDSLEDAAVVLISNSGGSGTFFDLAAVLNQNGRPNSVAAIQLGDRVQLKSISVAAGLININMITHGSSDPLCCPSLEVTQTYQLQGDQLIQVK